MPLSVGELRWLRSRPITRPTTTPLCAPIYVFFATYPPFVASTFTVRKKRVSGFYLCWTFLVVEPLLPLSLFCLSST